MNTKLTVNLLLPRANMSGGVKSNRLIAEALGRRGHAVNIAYVARPKPWPRLSQPREMLRRLALEWRMRGRQRHHLERSTVNLIPVDREWIEPDDVPDADVTIATWWETMEWLRDWPASKGRKAYFIRHHEVHAAHQDRVRATLRAPALHLVIATWLQRVMAEKYGDANAVLVPNGVDWTQFDSEPREKPPIPTVGMLYGQEPWKGAETAFEALHHVRREIPGVRAIAFGSKPIARGHRPVRDLEFHLLPPQTEIPQLYQQATCWLVPSTTEGFGMPGIEAAASRCPLVATRCGGPEDYVEEAVNGHLVPVGDARAMAERLIDVLRLPADDWRRMSEASYRIARRFDWDRSAERLEHALLSCAEARAA